MTPRLATSILVTAMLRRAEAEGGFGAVLAKGDPTSGSILLILLERGGNPRIYERVLQAEDDYSWVEPIAQISGKKQEVPDFIARRRRFDPDLWVLELDIPSAERFAAQMNEAG